MRLWHYKLIPFLPKSQLLAQWRELNSIFKNQPKHILINYVYEYPKYHLEVYASFILSEMAMRGYKTSPESRENFISYLGTPPTMIASPNEKEFRALLDRGEPIKPFPKDHDDEYLAICYFNLLEKFQRGQKDFDGERMYQLANYCDPIIKRYMEESNE